MINYLSIAIMPLMFFGIITYGFMQKIKVFDAFIIGAKDGLETSVRILPSLIALLTAIAMFKSSGALDIIIKLLSPILEFIRLPEEVMPLALMRPISGSGSLAIVETIFKDHGPDSFAGRVASVMMGSTETTFYTLTVYFGSVNVKDTRYTVKAALLADLFGILTSVWVVRMLFY